jgi:hypothetical protein
VKTLVLKTACLTALFAALAITASAEVKRKRYTFDFDTRKRQSSMMKATNQAKQAFLRDYLESKFAPSIIQNLAEEIDIALDPPDQYLVDFKVISEKPSPDETQITLTVEGEIDTGAMVNAMVQFDVLDFGNPAPKIMVLPSSRFTDPSNAKKVRAMIYDSIKQAGLRPVAFEGITENVSIQVRQGGQLTPGDTKILIRKALEYGADYLIYIDTEADVRPFSQGGYIADTNFTYTILRPNANMILGESIISGRGNGASAMLAFDRALDECAPAISRYMVGNLYESIFADSDVITDTPQIKTQVELLVHEGRPEQVKAIADRLRSMGAEVNLGVGDGIISKLRLEVPMDDTQLYEWFIGQKWTVAGKSFTTPVVAYAENMVEVEVVPVGGTGKRATAAKPKPRPRNNSTAGNFGGRTGTGRTGNTLAAKPKISLKLRPAKFNP